MKFVRTIFIIVVSLLLGAVLLKNFIAKAALIGGVKAVTGLSTEVHDLNVGLFTPFVRIKGLRVLNPRGFPDRTMVHVPEFYVTYDLGSFMQGHAHLPLLLLRLEEFNVVRAADGRLNLNSVTALEGARVRGGTGTRQAGRAPEFQIDVLELKVGKVFYKDYTTNPPVVKEFAVNIDERYEHITNPYTLAGLVVSRALIKTSVAQLAHFDVKGLEAGVRETLKQSADLLGTTLTEGTHAAGEVSKGALGTAKDATETTTNTLKKLFGN